MTPQELKNSILQRAIQGRLVEQRAEEGTAEELYQQIQQEKQRLIKEKKIKKEKPLPEIAEEEVPFDIPESWMWVRVRDCISNRSGLSYNKENLSVKSENMIRVLRGGNILDMGYLFKADDVEISGQFVKSELLLTKNTIITPAVTSLDHVGKMGRIEKDYSNVVVGGFVLMLTPHLANDVFSSYLLYAFSSKYFRDCCRGIVNKSGQAFYNLSREKMMGLIVPLPPLAEQRRIVSKIEELLPLVDRYEKAWSRLDAFNKRFPVDMQKSILQTAIQGKLVEQRKDEGTGEELYQQIQAEKQRLIKEKKIKKGKPLPAIAEDEVPFDIPESWKWVRLGNVCKSVADGDHQPPPQVSSGIPFLVISNVSSGHIDFSNTRYVPAEYFQKLAYERIAEQGDMLFTVTGSYGIPVKVEDNVQFCFQRHIALLKPLIDWNYLYHTLKSPVVRNQCDRVATGTAQKTVGLVSLKNIIIPLPPLAEQKRIVARLEEMLPLCERLK